MEEQVHAIIAGLNYISQVVRKLYLAMPVKIVLIQHYGTIKIISPMT
jgi:hypothetical protein